MHPATFIVRFPSPPFLLLGRPLEPTCNPFFVYVQDGTLRLWEYRSGSQLQRCDLASLQEPGEQPGHKVPTCSPAISCCSHYGEVFEKCFLAARVWLLTVWGTHTGFPVLQCLMGNNSHLTLCVHGLAYRKVSGHT